MEHQELKKERHQLKQLSKTDTVRTARQEDKRTGEIRNIAYIVLLPPQTRATSQQTEFERYFSFLCAAVKCSFS